MQSKRTGMVWAAVIAAAIGIGRTWAADSAPASAPAAAASTPAATEASVGNATEPLASVDELLSKKLVSIDLEAKPITEVLDFLAKTYGIEISKRANEDLPQERITLKPDHPMAAREAINSVNDALLVLGYTMVETVKGDPPVVVATVLPTRRDAGGHVPVYYGNDPEKIAEGDTIRTQVFVLTNVEPAKARETIASVLGARADVTLNNPTHTMIVTDTGTHVHTAASLLIVLEKQAAEAKGAPATAPATEPASTTGAR